MQLNEDTYEFMRNTSEQIERITCSLCVYIENNISFVENYHYIIYNEALNKIRDRFIKAFENINDIFLDTCDSIECISEKMWLSDNAKNNLSAELQFFQECLDRLMNRCENIIECNSDTQNPYIANADDEIYQIFSDYKKLFSSYKIKRPDDDDVVASLIYSFYNETMNIYDTSFDEFDKIMKKLGDRIHEIDTCLKREEAIDYSKELTSVAKIGDAFIDNTQGIIDGITKKEIFTVVDKGMGIIKTISEEIGEVLPEESKAREKLKKIESYGKTIDLISAINLQEDFELSDCKTSAINTLGALGIIALSKLFHMDFNEKEQLDAMIAAAEATSTTISFVGSLISGNVYQTISKIPSVIDKNINFIIEIAKYFDKDEKNEEPEGVLKVLHNIAKASEEYEEAVEKLKADIIMAFSFKKPKILSKFKVHKGETILSEKMDEIIQSITAKSYEEKKVINHIGGSG